MKRLLTGHPLSAGVWQGSRPLQSSDLSPDITVHCPASSAECLSDAIWQNDSSLSLGQNALLNNFQCCVGVAGLLTLRGPSFDQPLWNISCSLAADVNYKITEIEIFVFLVTFDYSVLSWLQHHVRLSLQRRSNNFLYSILKDDHYYYFFYYY